MAEAANLVTSENRAEFMAQRMGMTETPKTDETPVVEETKTEPETSTDEEIVEVAPVEGDTKEGQVFFHGKWVDKNHAGYRIHLKTEQTKEARAEAARERTAREALEARLAALEKKEEPKVAETTENNQKPDKNNFTDAFEYAEKLAEWSAQQALLKRDKEDKEKTAKAEQEKIASAWNDRLKTVKAEIPDFDDKISSSTVKVSDQVRDAILDSDAGPKILYHLAENPEIAENLSRMTISQAIRAIGRMEIELKPETKETKETKEVRISKAPAPISPLKAASVPAEKISADGEFTGTIAEWKALRKAGKIK